MSALEFFLLSTPPFSVVYPYFSVVYPFDKQWGYKMQQKYLIALIFTTKCLLSNYITIISLALAWWIIIVPIYFLGLYDLLSNFPRRSNSASDHIDIWQKFLVFPFRLSKQINFLKPVITFLGHPILELESILAFS